MVEIKAYLDLYPQADYDRFVNIMKRLDSEYLAATRSKRERRQKEKR